MNERLNDVAWYSRLAIWLGAAVLLVESVTARSLGIVTVLAVLALALGLLGFSGGLAFHHRGLGRLLDALAGEPLPAVQSSVHQDQTAPITVVEREAVIAVAMEPTPAAPVEQIVESPSARGALSREVRADDALAGSECRQCGMPLELGDVAAICRRCGSIHHAACWVVNHFHCASAGCTGHGGLLAPEADLAAE